MRITPCQCEGPGWCERHQCYKSPMWFSQCRLSPQLFALWEEGRGPGQQNARIRDLARRRVCEHRGELLRTVQCPTCRSAVAVKVFRCPLHGECTVAKPIGETACCGTCSDYGGNELSSA